MNIIKPIHAETIQAGANLLKGGGIVVIPTDTVYGLAAHPAQAAACAKLQTIKGRDPTKPIALLIANLSVLQTLGLSWSTTADTLARAFWPGPLTLVVPCGDTYEGLRMPAHALLQQLLLACGGALRVTSANLSNTAPALTARAAFHALGAYADLILDDGPSPGDTASSVVKISATGDLTILREGLLTRKQILAAICNAAPPTCKHL